MLMLLFNVMLLLTLLFSPKNAEVFNNKKKMLTSAKWRRSWYYKVYFLKLNMFVYLRTKFQFSSIILTSFRQGGNFTPPFSP